LLTALPHLPHRQHHCISSPAPIPVFTVRHTRMHRGGDARCERRALSAPSRHPPLRPSAARRTPVAGGGAVPTSHVAPGRHAPRPSNHARACSAFRPRSPRQRLGFFFLRLLASVALWSKAFDFGAATALRPQSHLSIRAHCKWSFVVTPSTPLLPPLSAEHPAHSNHEETDAAAALIVQSTAPVLFLSHPALSRNTLCTIQSF
jgi:hypothetical protein